MFLFGSCECFFREGTLHIYKGTLQRKNRPYFTYQQYKLAFSKIKCIEFHRGVVFPKNSDFLFEGFTALTDIKGLEFIDVSQVTSCNYIFKDCHALKRLTLFHDFSMLKEARGAFYNCYLLTELNTGHALFNGLIMTPSLFKGCNQLMRVLCSFTDHELSHFEDTPLLTTLDLGGISDIKSFSYPPSVSFLGVSRVFLEPVMSQITEKTLLYIRYA